MRFHFSFKYLLVILAVKILLTTLPAQTLLVQPYLQSGTPTSMVIMWETNVNTESTVQYGLTNSLGNSTSGTNMNTLGGTILHTVNLVDLTPGTRYYYKVVTGNVQSSIFDFVSPPLRSSEAPFNIVLMSDMQKDGGNPAIFSNLINTSLLPYIDSHYGAPLSDHLHMAVLPGDVVDNGNSYGQWKNDFFDPAQVLWRSVPSYPAIGNHELNSQNYFNYYTLPTNGTQGYLEHWYYTDYSNVRVLSMDSNSPYRIPAQLNWVDSILNLSCADTLIDFVFAEMHHPFKSELWQPGEADYTGDIVQRLEDFTSSCGKPTIHFFGHTHAYARGESRDHNHLWVNVAVSGGNIDYWGEFNNIDYDEYIIGEDEYGFVLVEVTAGENPQFVLKRLSYGDQYNPGGSSESDLVTIRMNNIAPVTPITLFPKVSDTVSAFCFTLQADGFTDPDNDGFGAAHWQVSEDSLNFTSPVFESWKQYENWFQEVDLQANDDLTDEEVTTLQGGQAYWWRVRYRDKSMEWSPWSMSTKFHTRALDSLTTNLISNPGAESGINNWTTTVGVIESLNPLECAGINPYQGNKYFAVGALCVEFPFASAYQDLNIAAHANLVDASEVLVNYGGYLADYANTDEPSFALQFLNASGALISASDTIRHRQSAWTLKQATIPVPADTRTIRFIIMGTRFSGLDNDSYFDNIFCKLFTGDLACSYYAPPGPANGRIYVDVNGVGAPDGESWTTAYRTFGHALLQSNVDTSVHEIWIADGHYPVTTNAVRDTSFSIHTAVNIYGGFAGSETLLSQRNIADHLTLLTGEIADTNLINDNSFHVLVVSNILDTMLLDGLKICCGYADGPVDSLGGGLIVTYTNRKPVHIVQCILEGNYALQGSSIFNQGEIILEDSNISNVVVESVTGCSILNEGIYAILSLQNCTIHQQCINCPEAIQNTNGAVIKVLESVTIERE